MTYFKPNSRANGKSPSSMLANGIWALAFHCFFRLGVITPYRCAWSSLENLRRSRVSHDAEDKEIGDNSDSEEGEFHGLF
jgi:hypothetical protein